MVWGDARAWGDDIRTVDDQSTTNPISLLLGDPNARINIVVVCNPYRFGHIGLARWSWGAFSWGDFPLEPDSEKIGLVYLSTRGLVTDPDDTPPNINMMAALTSGYNFQASIPLIGSGGQASAALGLTTISINRDTDDLANAGWEGTDIVVKLGGRTKGRELAFWEYETLLDGVVAGFDYDESEMRVQLRDESYVLLDTIQQSQYLGDDSNYEGGADLTGQYKPRLFGDCFNVSGVLVQQIEKAASPGTYYSIYQLNDGPISGISAVRDNGVALSFDADQPLLNWLGATGEYATDLSSGLIAVWDEPNGEITADVTGSTFPNGAGYTAVAADIIGELLDEKSVPYEGGSFNAHAQQTIGYYTGTSPVSYRQVVDAIMLDLDGWAIQDRNGVMSLGTHRNLLDDVVWDIEGRTDQDEPCVISSLERLETPEVVYKVTIPYRRNWTQQDSDGLGDGVAPDDRERYSAGSRRTTEAINVSLRGKHPDALEYEPDGGGYLVNLADAEAIRNGISGRYTRHRDLWQIAITRPRFQISPGEIVRFYFDRFGLTTGAQGECVSVNETDDETIIQVVALRLAGDATQGSVVIQDQEETYYLILEDGSGFLLLENDDKLLLEGAP